MTTSERSTIRLSLRGADYPDGEIPLADLAAIADRGQQLATRLARAEEGRGGPGRTPTRLAEGVRLMFVGIERGSTQLLIAGPPRDPQFDLGPLTEEAIERTLGRLVDGLDAAATGSDLPEGYDDLSRRALADWLDALAHAAPELDAEGRIGARPVKQVHLQPAAASERLREEPPTPEAPSAIRVEGRLYAVDLLNGRYRVEDDMGSRIDLVTTLFTADDVRPLLGQRVVAVGTPEYSEAGRIREVDATTIALAEDIPGLDASRFRHNIELDELLRDAQPLGSIDDLAIPGLTEDEIDAFLRALRE
jgi:hypothetical protein